MTRFIHGQNVTLFMLVIVCAPWVALADSGDIFEAIIRGTAKVSDDIPLRHLDELAGQVGRSPSFRRFIDESLTRSGQLSNTMSPVLRGVAHSDEVLRLLKGTLGPVNPAIIRKVDQLDDASRSLALVLSRGGESLQHAVPDIALRGRFLRAGGGETLAAIGLHGDETLRSALRVNEAIAAGTLKMPPGLRAVSLADFGQAMMQFGDASWTFWQRYVTPHWKLWLASGALGAYLLNPEMFQDAAGKLTERGFAELTKLAGAVTAAAISGIKEGGEKAGQEIIEEVKGVALLSGPGILGSAVFFVAILLCFRRTRYYLLRPFVWLNTEPRKKLE